jgi:hypothetical protein
VRRFAVEIRILHGIGIYKNESCFGFHL